MTKTMSKMLIFVGIFFALVFGWYGVKKLLFWHFISNYKQPPVTISATKATLQNWRPSLTAVGTLNAVNGVDITPDVAGIIQEVHFKSGEFVKAGDVLVTLKSDIEQANLKSALAKLQLATLDYDREKALFNKKVSSQSLLDRKQAELLEAKAGVESIRAQIKYKTIYAPFDGKLGIRQVNVGQFVSPGFSIVTLQSLDPLYVTFSVPEQQIDQLFLNQEIDVATNLSHQATVKGKISAFNSKVDQATRNILVRSTIPNTEQHLYPGMYALITIWLKEVKEAIVIPQTAVAYSLSGDYVFVIDESKGEKHVHRQYVKLGLTREGEVAVTEGLKVGDEVVTSGQLKLQNDTVVVIDNKTQL